MTTVRVCSVSDCECSRKCGDDACALERRPKTAPDSNVLALPVKSRLETRHGTTPQQMHSMVRTIFLWMYDHDVNQLTIKRNDKKATIFLDGETEKGD